MVLLEGTFYNALGIFIALCLGLITFFKWRYTYWTRKGIPSIPPTIPFGNLKEMFLHRRSYGQVLQDIYNHAKSKGYKHIGAFFLARPVYVVIDPELIRQILVKDFSHFMNRSTYLNEKDDPLSAHLFALRAEKWKILRQKFTPTFTSGQLKFMFQTLVDCAKKLEEFMNTQMAENAAMDIKDVMARYTTDIIGSCAFGIECNTLKDPDADFRKYGKLSFEQGFIGGLKLLIFNSVPSEYLNFLRIKNFRTDVSDFFLNAVNDVVNYREKNNVRRKDFMDLLIQLKNRGKIREDDETEEITKKGNEITLTLDQLAAQAYVFYLAGFETSSTTMTFGLFELAQNQAIQDKLREEINTVLAKHNGEITYDAVMDMPYLQNVIDESLRKYPPLPLLDRVCTKDYQIPNTNVVLEKHTYVYIPVLGIHRDPEYYPNPDVFDPDRFSPENKASIPPYTYLPFGEGPRNCIGLRFGLLQTKVGLITLLKDHRVVLNPKTTLPLQIDTTTFILTSACDIWLNIIKLNK